MNISETIKDTITAKNHKYLEFIEENDQGVTVRFLKPGHEQQKTRMTHKNGYYRVVTGEKEGKAEMFLYGFIGQDFWFDKEMNEESITDISFIRAFRKLEKDFDRIDIRINSPGGSVLHGDPIIAAIRNSKAEVHTYVDGIAASMAADIWMAGHVRHMSVNSKLMIHSTWSVAVGNAKDMMAAANQLEKFDEAAIATFSKATGWTEEETRERFYDHEDHWLTAKEIEELGLIERIEDAQTDTDTPEAPEKASYAELVNAFADQAFGDSEKENKSNGVAKNPEKIVEQETTGINLVTIDLEKNIEDQIQEIMGDQYSVSIDFAEIEEQKEEIKSRLNKARTIIARNAAYSK